MQKIPFTGFDGFLLTLDKHYRKLNLEGNICYYVIDLDREISFYEFSDRILSNSYLNDIHSLKAIKPNPISKPFWVSTNKTNLIIEECESDEIIPLKVQARKLTPDTSMLAFDLVKRSIGRSSVILSWHHLILDGYGASLLLQHLFDVIDTMELYKKDDQIFNLSTFLSAAKAKFFIDRSSRSPISTLVSKKVEIKGFGKLRVLTFGQKEMQSIDASAIKNKARFGRSAYYLTCASRAVNAVLERRNQTVANFWIPVPRDDRKKGAKGPLIGNRLSFLFYRISNRNMLNISDCVEAVNSQMLGQIKSKIPQAYNHLMNYMKWLPLNIYLYLIKRRSGNSIASFLFTIAADHPINLTDVCGSKITNALSIPANPCPPGLTFAFMKFKDSLQLMMLYHQEAISDEEIVFMEKHIHYELVNGKEYA